MSRILVSAPAVGSRSRLLQSISILVLSLATITTLLSAAIYTDTQSVGGNTFTTGSVDISTSPTSSVVSFSGMVPGDKVTAPINVTNDGTIQLRYTVKSTTTENTLAAQLDMTWKSGVTTCTNAGFGTDGTVLYGPADLGSTTGVNVVGDPTQGGQTGDRTLAASGSEILCIQVSLPSATGSGFQGLTSTATFEFAAEQTANNA
jgi:camelysin-like metallo-endopeptidase